jgi:phosphatidylglycerophosphatase A
MSFTEKIKPQTANVLTALRIALVAPFVLSLFGESIGSGFISILLFLTATITDYLDGYLSRKWGTSSVFGEFMDPLADKILVGSAFISFALMPELRVPFWLVGLILLREVTVTLMRVAAMKKKRPITTEFSGKLKTAWQMFSILCILFLLCAEKILLSLKAGYRFGPVFALAEQWTGTIKMFLPPALVSISAFLAFFSMVQYILKNRTLFHFSGLMKFFATGFYAGCVPGPRGTYGALVGVCVWLLFSRSTAFYPIVFVFVVGGTLVADYAEKNIFKEKDSANIVIDEVAGMLVAYTTFHFHFTVESIVYLTAGFLLFRFFDILKPPPIRNLQKLRGGVGITLDDAVSGILSNALLQLLRMFISPL